MSDPHIFKLSNGIRVVYQQVINTRIFHAGVILDVGSRDEDKSTQGITHFWEHMAFKGTKKRKAHHILHSLDAIGGELNAFTDKEKVVFYASVRDDYAERAIDLLSDITFNSIFPQNEIEKECGVILEEMAMYLDNPDDSLQDEFETLIYREHPMGMNILGRPESITSFHRSNFLKFYKQHMDTNRVVFSCVGSLPVGQIEKLARRYFDVKKLSRSVPRKKSSRYTARKLELFKPVKQARCAIGRTAYNVHHKNRIPFYLLVNMLGGPGMNSRLNLALREKYGYVYSIDAHYISYTDTGMFSVFFGTEPKQLDRCIVLIRNEFDILCNKLLSPRQLKSAKEQIKGQLAIAEENNLSLMLMMGRTMLDVNRVPTLEEVFEIIDGISASHLQQVAQEMFKEKDLSYLRIFPSKKNGTD